MTITRVRKSNFAGREDCWCGDARFGEMIRPEGMGYLLNQ